MTEKLEILVVEDQLKHLADVKTVLEGRKQYGIEANYVSTLDDAKRKLEEKRYDGILSDIFFPEREGEEESANGFWMAEYGIENDVPFVLVTSSNHHGSKTSTACRKFDRTLEEKYEVPHFDTMYRIVDCEPLSGQGLSTYEGDRKNWEGGFMALMYFIERFGEGDNSVKDIFTKDGGFRRMKEAAVSAGIAVSKADSPYSDQERRDILKMKIEKKMFLDKPEHLRRIAADIIQRYMG